MRVQEYEKEIESELPTVEIPYGVRQFRPRPVSPLGSRLARVGGPSLEAEETLVVDARAEMRPAQWVEHKLVSLRKCGLALSQLRLAASHAGRQHC